MSKQTIKLVRNLVIKVAAVFGGMLVAGLAMAEPSAITLSSISSHVDSSVGQLATVLTDVSLIAGVGFVMASFFKFHQHKLNPTQVSLSQGITLLLIGAGLMLFPTMLPTATHALFGSATIAKTGGGQIGSLISS